MAFSFYHDTALTVAAGFGFEQVSFLIISASIKKKTPYKM